MSIAYDYRLRARAWQARAEELRVIAEQFAHPRARSDLLDLASAWSALADREEARGEVDIGLPQQPPG
jgi:hypothetical protein